MALFSKKPKLINVRHVCGLPIPEEVICSTSLADDKFCITAGNNRFELLLEQILEVSFDMNVDVERYSKSSKLAGAVGAVAFGVAGAIIGSAPIEKKKNLVTGCVIIHYLSSSNTEEYMLFKDTAPNSLEAAKLADLLKSKVKKPIQKTTAL